MATTIWKGQIAFGLVSFPVRLQAAAQVVNSMALQAFLKRAPSTPPPAAPCRCP